MSDDNLIWNPILNYICQAIKAGNRSDNIAQKTMEFFSEDSIVNAKELLWPLAGISTRFTVQKKIIDNVLDIIKVFHACEDKKTCLPRFVIFEPDEAPIITGEITATLTRKVNELCVKFNNFVESSPSSHIPAPPVCVLLSLILLQRNRHML
jgi:hypothetical protein